MLDDPLNMLILAKAMVRYPKRTMRNVAVITTSGGGGAISADRLSQAGIPLSQFTPTTRETLAIHYSEGQASNPIDVGGASTRARTSLAWSRPKPCWPTPTPISR
ncbi:hypothetical protein LP416_09930 [Polaromonas sp. P2-4]|nr:hypothetical protein LP416_09930 [Polaromonas sp. P2-4]